MSDPKRLLDDPTAPDELRAALAVEVERAAAWDPAALGARVAGALSPAAATAAPAGVAPLGTAALFGPKALVAAAVVGAALGAAGHAALQPRASAAAPQVPAPVAAMPTSPAPFPEAPAAPADAPAPAAKAAPPAPSAPRPSTSRGALVDELRLYERGEAALLEGHFEVAVRELQRYLAEHPRGTLRAEAELALVQALARAGRCDEALARAERGAPAAHRKALLAATAACAKSR